MPIYEYRCSTCGKTFEKLQKFSDPPLEVHAECGGKLEKLISTSALQFKGSGFYITDYKGGKADSGSKSDAAKTESKTETKSNGGGETKSESKSGESKSESKTESKPVTPAAKSD